MALLQPLSKTRIFECVPREGCGNDKRRARKPRMRTLLMSGLLQQLVMSPTSLESSTHCLPFSDARNAIVKLRIRLLMFLVLCDSSSTSGDKRILLSSSRLMRNGLPFSLSCRLRCRGKDALARGTGTAPTTSRARTARSLRSIGTASRWVPARL